MYATLPSGVMTNHLARIQVVTEVLMLHIENHVL